MTDKEVRENAAANAVLSHLSAVLGSPMAARRWDDGSARSMHDFYIEGGDNRIALEVTTMADGQRVGRDLRWTQAAPGGWIKVEGLTGCWLAYHGGDAEALDVIETIRAQVPRLEALGITEAHTRAWQKHAFTPDDLRPPDNEPMRALSSAGITQVSRVVEASEGLMKDHGGQVQVVRGFGVDRPADRNFPVTVIEEQLREPALHRSDINKLLEVDDATARHLWLWVEITEGLAMIRSFDVEGLPDVGIATEIDGVWLGRSPAPDVVAGYVWFRDVGWSRFESSRNEVIAS